MKKISQLFLFTILISLTACAARDKQVKPSAVTATSAAVQAEEAAPAAKVEAVEAPVKVDAPLLKTSYIVRPNDTLEKIAKLPDVYGNRKAWPVIFEGNRDRLGHPSKIYPGQKLRIPREPAEIAALEKRAGINKVVLVSDQALREARAVQQRRSAAAKVTLSPPVVANPVAEALKPQTEASTEVTGSAPAAEPTSTAAVTSPAPSVETVDTGSTDNSGLQVETDTDTESDTTASL